MKEEFIEYYTAHVKRDGSAELLTYLQKSDFFTAPASTRFHGSYEGGLVEHSINVYKRLVELNQAAGGLYSDESVAICGLLHDLCKIGFYSVEMRNRKNEQGQWEKYPYYVVSDQLPYGHGEKSQYIVASFMKLSREESFAIRWHMGGFDASVRGGSAESVSLAFDMYKLALFTHIADMMASHMDESKKDEETA